MPKCYLCGEPCHWIKKNNVSVCLHDEGVCRLDICALLEAIFRAFTRPAKCPECGQNVFFHQATNGGRVFFDFLGPPWPKHFCTSRPMGEAGPPCVPKEGFQEIRICDVIPLEKKQMLKLRFEVRESGRHYDLTLKGKANIVHVLAQLKNGNPFHVSIDDRRQNGVLSTYDSSSLAARTGPPTSISNTPMTWARCSTVSIMLSPSPYSSAKTATNKTTARSWTPGTCAIGSGGCSGPGCCRGAQRITAAAGGPCIITPQRGRGRRPITVVRISRFAQP